MSVEKWKNMKFSSISKHFETRKLLKSDLFLDLLDKLVDLDLHSG